MSKNIGRVSGKAPRVLGVAIASLSLLIVAGHGWAGKNGRTYVPTMAKPRLGPVPPQLAKLGYARTKKQVKIDRIKRSKGPGGQKVNKTASAVRVTHLATGIFALASDTRSQAQNHDNALTRMEAALLRHVASGESLTRPAKGGAATKREPSTKRRSKRRGKRR